MPTETRIGKTVLRLVTGDIAEQDTDAVVTADADRLRKYLARFNLDWQGCKKG
jgi:sigma54-dependent transcription regulator